MNINISFFEQPIGRFALAKMNAKDIITIMTKDARKYDPLTFEATGGPQRELNEGRVREIAKYAKDDPNACFPTAIILSLPECDEDSDILWKLENDTSLYISENAREFALLVDGQHRMYGLKEAGDEVCANFEIPVVFLFEATLEQQAIIFSIINEKQTKVSFSLVSQLFGVIDVRTAGKVAHNFASALNSRKDSPFFQRVKMLGKKSPTILNETLSQGTIVRQLMPLLLSNGKNNVLYEFYATNEDSFALKVLLNYFSAAQETWPFEWNSANHIITKTVGFTALVKAFPTIFKLIDDDDKIFTKEKFKGFFDEADKFIKSEGLQLTSSDFPSSGAGATKLSKIILRGTT